MHKIKNVAVTAVLLSLLMLHGSNLLGQAKPASGLERTVTITLYNEQPQTMLDLIGRQCNVVFSYSPKVLENRPTVTISAKQQPIRLVLYNAFGESIRLKDRGKYIILIDNRMVLQQPFGDRPQVIEGYITDPKTGNKVSNATVYDKNLMVSATTDQYGYFKIKVPYGETETRLRVSKVGYSDTTIVPVSKTSNFVSLDLPALSVAPIDESSHKRGLLGITFPKWLLSEKLWTNSVNVGDTIYRTWQLSLLPYIGTNHHLSGNVVNTFSVNILGGYSQGVAIAEIGGLVNITRKDARYFMASGANHVGGHMLGVQIAGIYNRTQTVTGFQAAGLLNKSFGKVKGVQISGIAGITPGSLQGVQISGIYSHNTNNSGVQLSGILSMSRLLNGTQISGIASYGKGIAPVGQMSGILNILRGSVKGAQIAGIANTVTKVDGAQLSGITNIAQSVNGAQCAGIYNKADTVKGVQISGILNSTKVLNGFQLGLVNLADSGNGAALGLFSYIKKGYHRLEISSEEFINTSIAFRSGTKRLYNIISTGIRMNELQHPIWSIGFGFGSSVGVSQKVDLDMELHAKSIYVAQHLDDKNNLYQLYVGLNRSLGKRRSLALGITANLLYYRNPTLTGDRSLERAIPYKLLNYGSANEYINSGWIGGKIAFRF